MVYQQSNLQPSLPLLLLLLLLVVLQQGLAAAVALAGTPAKLLKQLLLLQHWPQQRLELK
jgi:hypothetical protein